MIDSDEFQRRRFRRETEVLLDPQKFSQIEEDEYNIDQVLRKDSDPTRAEHIAQIARDFSKRAQALERDLGT